MKNFPIPRLDQNPQLHDYLIRHCRLSRGEIWVDPQGKHKIGCLDATDKNGIKSLMGESKAALAIQDPPYNLRPLSRDNLMSIFDGVSNGF